MSKALIIGGTSGVGLAMSMLLVEKGYEKVVSIGRELINEEDIPAEKREQFFGSIEQKKINLVNEDYSFLDEYNDIDTLFISVGFGRVCEFEKLTVMENTNLIRVNFESVVKITEHFYSKIKSEKEFYCGVMGSIAGRIASPLLSMYGATKAGVCAFIENLNIELAYNGFKNRILEVSPGVIKGTAFYGKQNNIEAVKPMAEAIFEKMQNHECLYIPDYEEVYKGVIERYQKSPLEFGLSSYEYKKERISDKPSGVIGYLSGTFDLFHIGHLNLLKRAKENCDYLIVGVHKDGSWKGKETFISYDERVEILRSVKYVDKVVMSLEEDAYAYDAFHINKLFVGSDYKGTERFRKYEEYLKDKNVEIIYFPYTKNTSSTQLRQLINNKNQISLKDEQNGQN